MSWPCEVGKEGGIDRIDLPKLTTMIAHDEESSEICCSLAFPRHITIDSDLLPLLSES